MQPTEKRDNHDEEIMQIIEEIRNAKASLQSTIEELKSQCQILGQREYELTKHLSHQKRIEHLFH